MDTDETAIQIAELARQTAELWRDNLDLRESLLTVQANLIVLRGAFQVALTTTIDPLGAVIAMLGDQDVQPADERIAAAQADLLATLRGMV